MALSTTLAPLAVGFVGLGGVMFTQIRADRRARLERDREDVRLTAERERENVRLSRERERDQATWAREDADRSYEHRRDAYVDFVKELHQQQRTSVAVDAEAEEGHGDPNWKFPDDWFDRSYSCLVQIQIFGTKEAAMLAEKALQTFYYGSRLDLQDMLDNLQSEIRRDLSIPDRPA
jgi:hypothetical protein